MVDYFDALFIGLGLCAKMVLTPASLTQHESWHLTRQPRLAVVVVVVVEVVLVVVVLVWACPDCLVARRVVDGGWPFG